MHFHSIVINLKSTFKSGQISGKLWEAEADVQFEEKDHDLMGVCEQGWFRSGDNIIHICKVCCPSFSLP